MAGIYFIAAGNSSRNRNKSLDRGLCRESLQKLLSKPLARRLSDHFAEGEDVYAWGANKEGDLTKLEAGDYVVDIKNKDVVQVFQFAFFFKTEDTVFQDWVDWDGEKPTEERRPYSFVYFLRNSKSTSRKEKQFFADAFDLSAKPQWLMGQKWFSNTEILKAMRRTNSSSREVFLGIDEEPPANAAPAVHTCTRASSQIEKPKTLNSERSLVVDNLAQDITISAPWLDPVIDQIKQLQAESKTLEREHEDAVAHFFELLGYKRGSEIKFQRGRVDILITPDIAQKTSPIVIEVKRNWALSKDSMKDIHQAHRYALENGAQIVILTNGDLYLIYDRERGLQLNEQFLGEFRLTQLTKFGLDLVSSLRRDRYRLELGRNNISEKNLKDEGKVKNNIFIRIKNLIRRIILRVT